MRVTFFRFPPDQRCWSLVERDDGVAYRMYGPAPGGGLPHDLVHFTAERTLRIPDGIWGAVASGVVFRSMRHESGRRPPHAAERSMALIRIHRDRLKRAELLGGLVERIAAVDAPTPQAIARLTRESLATLPDADIEAAPLRAAADALRRAALDWRGVRVGDGVTLDWPGRLRMPAVPAGGPARDGYRSVRRRSAHAAA